MQQPDIGRIYNEHCQITMRRMPDDFLDMTLTSPPYDDLRSYNGHTHVPYKIIADTLYKKTKPGGVMASSGQFPLEFNRGILDNPSDNTLI